MNDLRRYVIADHHTPDSRWQDEVEFVLHYFLIMRHRGDDLAGFEIINPRQFSQGSNPVFNGKGICLPDNSHLLRNSRRALHPITDSLTMLQPAIASHRLQRMANGV